MGIMQKRKGNRVEREIVKILKNAGVNAKRVPLSGSAEGFKSDIIINETIKCEVKARKDGFKNIYLHIPISEDSALKLTTGRNRLVIVKMNKFIRYLKDGDKRFFSVKSLEDKKLKQMDQWIENVDVLFLKANRKPVLAVMRISDFLKGFENE